MNLEDIKYDCKHFKGTVPCKPNKQFDYTCSDCPVYTKIEKRILIIKLGNSKLYIQILISLG